MADGQPPGPDQAAAALARARGTLDILARGSGPAGTVSAGGPVSISRPTFIACRACCTWSIAAFLLMRWPEALFAGVGLVQTCGCALPFTLLLLQSQPERLRGGSMPGTIVRVLCVSRSLYSFSQARP